jgi:hypothetical protein
MDSMSTDIDSLPDSRMVSMPDLEGPERIERQDTREYIQPNMQPNVGNIQARVKPLEMPMVVENPTVLFLRKLVSKDFLILLLLLFIADNRMINVNVLRHIPLGFVRNNPFVQALIKVLIIGVVFLVVKTYM